MRVAVVSGAALRSLVVLGTSQSRGRGLAFLTGVPSCENLETYITHFSPNTAAAVHPVASYAGTPTAP